MTKEEAKIALANLKRYMSGGGVVDRSTNKAIDMAIEALSHPEPHWIPVTERLPEEPFGCLVTVWDTNPVTMDEFENILPYFVGWDGEQWNDADGEQCPFEVIAWWELPEPFKELTDGRD